MASSILVIRDQQVLLDDVMISAGCCDADGESCLAVDLFSDSRELSRHGFALNGIAFSGVDSLESLQGQVAVLRADDEEADALAESVICEPGQVLEINAMQLNFGEIADGHFTIDFLAICSRIDDAGNTVEDEIRVLGCLNAEIRARQ